MSQKCWVSAFLRGLLVLNLHYIYGLFHDCSVCCVIQDEIRNLNCSWRSEVRTEHSVSLKNLKNPDEPPFLFNVTQNWLLIPRKDLVIDHEYHLTLSGGGKNHTHNFTYSDYGHNIFIRPPLLNSSISESNGLEVTWKHPEEWKLEQPPVELRYRILGPHNWMEVDGSDLEETRYVLDDPVPYTQYEFQIRYLPDENNNKGSPWSESHILTSPEMVPNGSVDIWRSLQNGSSLLVMWKPLDQDSARGKILGYQVTYGVEETITEEPCCSKVLPAQSSPVCVRARNSEGLGPPACVTPQCTDILDAAPFSCTVQGDAQGRISIRCDDPPRMDKVLGYIVEWRELREDEKTQVHWTRHQALTEALQLPGTLTSGVPYSISVYVLSNSSCTKAFSTEAYSQEEVPTAAPYFFIHTLSDGNVLVSWEEIPIQHRRGIITHNSIYLKSRNRSEHHRVSNRSGSMSLLGLSSGTGYTIWMTASTRVGEGPQRILQITENRHRALLIVAIVILIFFVCIVFMCFCDCKISFWPKIPKPEAKFKELFLTSSGNTWQPQEVSLNPLIEVVEEIEPPPQPPTPPPPPSPPLITPPSPPQPSTLLNKAPAFTSGYEKHFMPTPEEIMCLG
ncbi:interleukin-27 receptor subunit alpha [Dendropsophus ebraccatus]|uniref:interleukin-27 receptor subunit alpha n=1 Tax=Dendropsophus ebraccatus TaxID=150705 RepID=UPI003831FBA0